jgi:hypothetical protein
MIRDTEMRGYGARAGVLRTLCLSLFPSSFVLLGLWVFLVLVLVVLVVVVGMVLRRVALVFAVVLLVVCPVL